MASCEFTPTQLVNVQKYPVSEKLSYTPVTQLVIRIVRQWLFYASIWFIIQFIQPTIVDALL